jgi:hypothetical protein
VKRRHDTHLDATCSCGLPMFPVLRSCAGDHTGPLPAILMACEHCDSVCRVGKTCERCQALGIYRPGAT